MSVSGHFRHFLSR